MRLWTSADWERFIGDVKPAAMKFGKYLHDKASMSTDQCHAFIGLS